MKEQVSMRNGCRLKETGDMRLNTIHINGSWTQYGANVTKVIIRTVDKI